MGTGHKSGSNSYSRKIWQTLLIRNYKQIPLGPKGIRHDTGPELSKSFFLDIDD